jgi:hypothetical protein
MGGVAPTTGLRREPHLRAGVHALLGHLSVLQRGKAVSRGQICRRCLGSLRDCSSRLSRSASSLRAET